MLECFFTNLKLLLLILSLRFGFIIKYRLGMDCKW